MLREEIVEGHTNISRELLQIRALLCSPSSGIDPRTPQECQLHLYVAVALPKKSGMTRVSYG